jgi:hypothetical protein
MVGRAKKGRNWKDCREVCPRCGCVGNRADGPPCFCVPEWETQRYFDQAGFQDSINHYGLGDLGGRIYSMSHEDNNGNPIPCDVRG